MYYLDYLSSYFCVVGFLWFLMIICVKYIPIILKQGEAKAEKWQLRLFLLSIPSSFVVGYTVFHFLNLYEYMRLV